MQTAKQSSKAMQQVADMVKKIRIGMLTTEDESGLLVSRPMQAVRMDADGAIWFFTKAHSAKTHQLDRVNLTFTDRDDLDYLSLAGSAELVFDRARMDELWSAMARPWFPGGKDDPELALLRVSVDTAELWDANDSRMLRLLGVAAATVTGKPNAVMRGDKALIRNPARH